MKISKQNQALALILITTALLSSACLRTRSQLRGDDGSEGPSQPVPAKVQEVQPAGGYVIDEIKSEITRLNGRIEDLERAQAQKPGQTAASEEMIKKFEARIIELETAQTQMLEALQKMRNSPAVAAASDPVDQFELGKKNYESGDYSAAIENFTEYLKNKKGKHIQEATFLRGESYFAQKQHKRAIQDYAAFAEKFTSSKRVPAALYKIGLSFEAMGMKDDAKNFFQDLVEKFPKAPEAKMAKGKLR